MRALAAVGKGWCALKLDSYLLNTGYGVQYVTHFASLDSFRKKTSKQTPPVIFNDVSYTEGEAETQRVYFNVSQLLCSDR